MGVLRFLVTLAQDVLQALVDRVLAEAHLLGLVLLDHVLELLHALFGLGHRVLRTPHLLGEGLRGDQFLNHATICGIHINSLHEETTRRGEDS